MYVFLYRNRWNGLYRENCEACRYSKEQKQIILKSKSFVIVKYKTQLFWVTKLPY